MNVGQPNFQRNRDQTMKLVGEDYSRLLLFLSNFENSMVDCQIFENIMDFSLRFLTAAFPEELHDSIRFRFHVMFRNAFSASAEIQLARQRIAKQPPPYSPLKSPKLNSNVSILTVYSNIIDFHL